MNMAVFLTLHQIYAIKKNIKKTVSGESDFLQFATIPSPKLPLSASKLNVMSNSCQVNEPVSGTKHFKLP